MKNNRKQIGAVVTFREGMSMDRVEKIIMAIHREFGNDLTVEQVNDFNPEWGHPVFYVP